MKAKPRKSTKMAKKNQPNKGNQIARAYMLSFPQLLTWAVIFAFVGGLTVWTGLAASNRPPGGGGSTATVTAAPNPTTPGTQVYLTGCGYTVAVPASVKVLNSAGSLVNSFSQPMGAGGCLSNGYFLAGSADTYTVLMYQKSSTHKNATDVLKATTTLTVQ